VICAPHLRYRSGPARRRYRGRGNLHAPPRSAKHIHVEARELDISVAWRNEGDVNLAPGIVIGDTGRIGGIDRQRIRHGGKRHTIIRALVGHRLIAQIGQLLRAEIPQRRKVLERPHVSERARSYRVGKP